MERTPAVDQDQAADAFVVRLNKHPLVSNRHNVLVRGDPLSGKTAAATWLAVDLTRQAFAGQGREIYQKKQAEAPLR